MADAIARMGLAHAVITSVDRDDLEDGGACAFRCASFARSADTRRPPRSKYLTPDFLRKDGALEQVVEARPDVFNHNLETVPVPLSANPPGRALLPFAAPVAAREGTGSA